MFFPSSLVPRAAARVSLIFLLILGSACQTSKPGGSSTPMSASETDPNLWLEEVESPQAIAKVRSWNNRTLAELEADPRYKGIEQANREIILAKDRIPYGGYRGGFVYNLWQDEKNVRGLWRRSTLVEYKKKSPKWDVLIDLDELSAKEKENWVWKAASCLAPDYDRCLITLSRGGKDASVVREYSIQQRAFVKGGFEAPEAKSTLSWMDKDTLFIGTDFGAGSMSKAGYPLEVRIWKRGEPLANAKTILRAQPEDMSAHGYTVHTPDGNYSFVSRTIDFDHSERFMLNAEGQPVKMPVPLDLIGGDILKGWFAVVLRTDLPTDKHGLFKSGSVVAYNLKDLNAEPRLVYAPAEREAVSNVSTTKDFFVLSVSANVKGRLLRAIPTGEGAWKIERVDLPDNGEVELASSENYSNVLMVNYASFLIPDTVFSVDVRNGKMVAEKLRSLPARFDAHNLKVEQREATSKDGTKIPYFLVGPKKMKLDGTNPTLLYGYGGFMVPMTPHYAGAMGKVFLEKGGVYVLANIRGGSEFGPKWHEAALKKNRQRAYDDFIAVAEDLETRKVTSPKWLAIRGGSNGGLLTGTVFTQRPDLFGAVLCEVPLLDMLRYHKLLAGFSWMAEYGNPDVPDEAAAIRKYSPYQNLKAETKYPRIFLLTSTKDDRVHPGHARKMAARLESMGHPFLYYENIEGGHGAAANLEQRIKFNALEWTYVWRQLGVGK